MSWNTVRRRVESTDITSNAVPIDYILELTSGVTGSIVELLRQSARVALARQPVQLSIADLQHAGKLFAADLGCELPLLLSLRQQSVSAQPVVFSSVLRYLASFFEIRQFGVKSIPTFFCQAMLSLIEMTGAAYDNQKEEPQAIDETSSRPARV